MAVLPFFSKGEVEPRHKESGQTAPTQPEKSQNQASSGAISSRRALGAVIGILLLVAVGGVVASGFLGGTLDDVLDGTGGPTGEGEIATEAFEPPVNSTVLREAHRDGLNAAGSFTIVEEYTVEGTGTERPLRDETITSSFDLKNNQSLVEISANEYQMTAYHTGTEKYARTEGPSGEPQYQIPDRVVSPKPYLDSNILGELETMDVDHRKTESGHVYTANGVDAVSEGFLNGDVDSFRSFEFEAVVSDQGVLEEIYYQIEIENSGEIITVTRSVNITEVGTTTVREPAWLDAAREATS